MEHAKFKLWGSVYSYSFEYLHWLPVHSWIKFKISVITFKLLTWHRPVKPKITSYIPYAFFEIIWCNLVWCRLCSCLLAHPHANKFPMSVQCASNIHVCKDLDGQQKIAEHAKFKLWGSGKLSYIPQLNTHITTVQHVSSFCTIYACWILCNCQFDFLLLLPLFKRNFKTFYFVTS